MLLWLKPPCELHSTQCGRHPLAPRGAVALVSKCQPHEVPSRDFQNLEECLKGRAQSQAEWGVWAWKSDTVPARMRSSILDVLKTGIGLPEGPEMNGPEQSG